MNAPPDVFLPEDDFDDIDQLIHRLLVEFEVITPDSDPGVIHALVQKLLKHLGFLSLSGFSPIAWGIFIARSVRDIKQARRELDAAPNHPTME